MPEKSVIGRIGLWAIGGAVMVAIEVIDTAQEGTRYRVKPLAGKGSQWVSENFIVLDPIETNAVPGQIALEL